ncbi:Gfo/Idh/MocA family protein [Desulfobulbus oligotrophicus]|jgi:predicted dehydrogenase|uniref:Gfo/Idh/MocA family oxidoreductase n=1 Tax=Desulfobulbus oligotrophicus TaxID=1909699 RepID=A0A7T5VCR6_9BACT|nr:Gfo/Idh/MocA family oxidoreductase [Desulfobulbus oligotrophicus]MDY0389604.1 Gfo/Idh/MocA family oxidoreductase [Desulfobulbus oligotrophicus]QQG65432.1 Gfo/Idh/MocA family oxidoreductase [Desulfobulbus oligotrophicus]
MTAQKACWQVGIIGTGKHGSRYARHILTDIDDLELVAISRRSETGKEQASQWGCRWHKKWQDLVDDPEVDCIIATLPPAINETVAKACAMAAKPLLLEKPMAVSSAQALSIHTCFTRQGVGLTIGQTLRYNRVIQTLRNELPSIGTLHSFTADQRLEPATLPWLDDPAQAGAGVTFHSAVHVFDALRLITGLEVVRVMARIRCVQSRRLEDHLAALVEMENGVVGTVDCSKIGPARSGRFEFVGDKGSVSGDQVHNIVEQTHDHKRQEIAIDDPVNTIVPLLKDWSAFLNGQRLNPIPGEEGVKAVQICEACLRSAEKGGWQEV